ncbi:hypothetical protein N7488_008922 [Penicillium malachiteum]|nr:hypothetical protein N7488_008922 [Penicillium malachiteum]
MGHVVVPAGVPDRGPGLMTFSIVLLVLTTLMTLIRVVSRIITKQRWWWDDSVAVLSWSFGVIMFSLTIFAIKRFGFGLHEETIALQSVSYAIEGAKYFYVGMIFFNASVTLPKISALLFYARVFNTKNRSLRIQLWTLGALAGGWIFATTLVSIFQCDPVHHTWDTTIPGKCINTYHFYAATAAISSTIDIWILIIPVPLIWRLNSSLRRRIYLLVAFFLAYSVIVVSIGRLIVTFQIIPTYAEDMTWRMPIYMYWALMESSLSVISISVPNAIALVKHLKGHARSTTAGSSKSSKFTASHELNDSQSYTSIHGGGTTSIHGGGTSIGEHSEHRELVGAKEQDPESGLGDIRILTKIRIHH